MIEEVWTEPVVEPGICILCSKCKQDCLQSTQGWVCRECWQSVLRSSNPPTHLGRLAIMPSKMNYGYVLLDFSLNFLTFDKVLYFFRREQDARELLERCLRNESTRFSKIARMPMAGPFLYVLGRPELKMLCVRETAC